MLWQIKAFSHRCCVSDVPFETGDGYVSYLTIDENRELQRYDVSVAHDETFEPPGELLCRWRQIYKKEPEKEDTAKRRRETAESLFLSLYEEVPAEPAETEEETGGASGEVLGENEILKKFLAVLLERKRILRPRGESADGRYRLMEHARSKNIHPVPAGNLTPDEMMRISERLKEL